MSRSWPVMRLAAVAAGLSAMAGALAQSQPADSRFGVGVAQELAQRDKAAAARKRQLDLRELAARAAEKRLGGAQAAGVPAAGASLPEAKPEPEPSEAERLEELAKIYQAMKPKAAAPIFEQLSLEIQVKVAGRMRERSTAQIMSAMSPKAAAALTMAIAKRQTSYTVLSPPAPSPPAPAARR